MDHDRDDDLDIVCLHFLYKHEKMYEMCLMRLSLYTNFFARKFMKQFCVIAIQCFAECFLQNEKGKDIF